MYTVVRVSDALQFLFRFSLFALVHSILAIPSLKGALTRRNQYLRRFYRLYYNIVSVVLFGWVMSAYSNTAVLYVVPGVWSLVLYFLQLVFLVILFLCVRQTGVADFLGISRGTQTYRLVTSGWYRIVRHPLYLFSILFLVSNPVITVRWLLLTLISTVYFVVGACIEEKRLQAEFGDEYQAYQRSVPFLLPRLFNRKSA
jgi:protein-S-isoprenylcysteine O-methyltransferase Ste14